MGEKKLTVSISTRVQTNGGFPAKLGLAIPGVAVLLAGALNQAFELTYTGLRILLPLRLDPSPRKDSHRNR